MEFSNYVYLKDMFITLKRIEKIMFVLVSRILLISKFTNFPAVFTIKIKLSEVCMQLSVCESLFQSNTSKSHYRS